MREITSSLASQGAYLGAVYCCPHTSRELCDCKKPLPGMVQRAMSEFSIDVPHNYVIGDMGSSDMKLANAIGTENVLEAVQWILCQEVDACRTEQS